MGVAAAVGLGDDAAQAAARVEDAEDDLLVGVPLDDPRGDQLQQVGLAALVVPEDQQVLVAAEQVEQHGREGVLVDTDRHRGRLGGDGRKPPNRAHRHAVVRRLALPG